MDKGFTEESITALSACESPVESKIVGAVFRYDGMNFLMYETCATCKLTVSFERNGSVWSLQIQPAPEWLSGRRFDFLLVEARDTDICSGIHVEVDGKDFHSSVEQRDVDRRKDRVSLAHGFPVVRFSGSEAFHAPDSCVNQCIAIIQSMNDQKAKGRSVGAA